MDMPNHNPFCNGLIGKTVIDGQMHDVTNICNYSKLAETMTAPAVLINNQYIVPIKPDSSRGYGITIKSNMPFAIAKLPKEGSDELQKYTTQNPEFSDWREIKTMRDYTAASNMQYTAEVNTITSPDNIFKPTPTNEDSPAMYALKEAVCSKGIDIDKYSMRFGANFNNDKRLFNKNTISIGKLTRLCEGLDIQATLILQDKDTDTPNPMKNAIKVELTNGNGLGGDDDE